ncbi:MAG: hypothetical protein ACXVZV_11675 [Terriglobales bacterium]
MRESIRRLEQQGSRAARRSFKRLRSAVHLPVICVHDEEELEPEPVKGKPIISVDGKDIEESRRSAA